jgi:hypothetical protein
MERAAYVAKEFLNNGLEFNEKREKWMNESREHTNKDGCTCQVCSDRRTKMRSIEAVLQKMGEDLSRRGYEIEGEVLRGVGAAMGALQVQTMSGLGTAVHILRGVYEEVNGEMLGQRMREAVRTEIFGFLRHVSVVGMPISSGMPEEGGAENMLGKLIELAQGGKKTDPTKH